MTNRLTFGQFCSATRRGGALALCLALWTLGLGSADKPKPTFTTFDAPGAGTGANQGTFPGNINPAGTIAGYYLDASKVYHGFLRAKDDRDEEESTFTTFDAPGAGTGEFQGTLTAFFSGLNPAGAITGNYRDASNLNHGYVRAEDGTFTTFDPPGSQGTITDSINPAGVIAGFYGDASVVFHGFVRAPDGTFTTFDAPGAGTGFAQGTVPQNINPAGAITGYITDASNVNHGFVRAKGGSITTFDAPGAGTGAFQGTTPFSNDPAGAITGQYLDASNVSHGFLRTPRSGDSEEDGDASRARAGDSGSPTSLASSVAGIRRAHNTNLVVRQE
jgi:hypothetical protein